MLSHWVISAYPFVLGTASRWLVHNLLVGPVSTWITSDIFCTVETVRIVSTCIAAEITEAKNRH